MQFLSELHFARLVCIMLQLRRQVPLPIMHDVWSAQLSVSYVPHPLMHVLASQTHMRSAIHDVASLYLSEQGVTQ